MITLLYADNAGDPAASRNELIDFVRTMELKSPSESVEEPDALERQVYADDHFKLKIPASWLRVDAPDESGKKMTWYYAKEKGSIEGGYLQIYEQFNMAGEFSYDDYNVLVSAIAEGMQDDQIDRARSPVNQELMSVNINGYDGYMFGFDATKYSDYFYGYVYNHNGTLICLCLTDSSGDHAAIQEKLTDIANTLECLP